MPIYITEDHHVLRIEHKAIHGVDSHELYILEANGLWTPILLTKTFRTPSPRGVMDPWDEITYLLDTPDWDYVTIPTEPNKSGLLHARDQNRYFKFRISPDVKENNIQLLQQLYINVKSGIPIAPATPTTPLLKALEETPPFREPTLLDDVLDYAKKKHQQFNRFRWFHHRGHKADELLLAIGALQSKKADLAEHFANEPQRCSELVKESGLFAAVSKHRTTRKQGTNIKTTSQKELETLLPTLKN